MTDRATDDALAAGRRPGLLEQRYRSVLSTLPTGYRKAWEEDMVTAYLDAAHAEAPDDPDAVDLRRPTWSEVSAVLRLAVRLRLGASGGTPRGRVWGQALRQVAMIGMLVNAAGAINWPVVWLASAASLTPEAAPVPGWQGPLNAAIALLWPAAYVSALLDRRALTRRLALGALLPQLVSFAVGVAERPELLVRLWQLPTGYTLLLSAGTTLATTAFHREAPAVPGRPWAVALVVAVGSQVVLWVGVGEQLGADVWPWVQPAALYCLALAALAVAVLARRGTGAGRPDPTWLLAVALLAPLTAGLRLTSWVTFDRYLPNVSPSGVPVALQVGAIGIVAVVAAIGAFAGLRRVPSQ